ncbi:MAG: SEC-C metal-binding domain-containing protein [Candidatus Hydrogenedentes bacterium]|nr:SEC-C metal-binding domain-containing protein [Candidatus Hydrogenedentota bacterium]
MPTKLGPNTPCECGSGKKYKHCCGAEGADAKRNPKMTLVRGGIASACVVGLLLIVAANASKSPAPTAPPVKNTGTYTGQPAGPAPAGKVWSAEHGHWHEATEGLPQQYQSAPQPPGAAPPGKTWSAEHGHWHDLPGANPAPPAP